MPVTCATSASLIRGRCATVAISALEPQSAKGVDLTTVALGAPRRLYDAIVGRTRFDGAIPLAQLTENP